MGWFWSKKEDKLSVEEWKEIVLEEHRVMTENYKKEKAQRVKDFINKGNNDFIDISMETKRVYRFPNDEYIIIHHPVMLSVKDNGHRVWDAAYKSHYIPTGWMHLTWEVVQGEPNFVK